MSPFCAGEGASGDAAELDGFLAWLKERWAVDWSDYRPDYLRRRLRICMAAAGLSTLEEYRRLLDRDEEARRRLQDTLTVNVTEFFRDPSTFRAFQELVIPELVEIKRKNKGNLIRVWSAGCASGEEPLSIALSFLRVLGPELHGFWVSVYGTDVDETALACARKGVYSPEALKPAPPEDVKRYFRERPDGGHAVGDALRRLVRYQKLDLIHDAPLTHVDVIFCRYLFIYMSREFQERVMRSFHSSLNQQGFVVLGRTESMPVSLLQDLYEWVSPEERIYRKRPTEVFA